jgi:hypothetical protein
VRLYSRPGNDLTHRFPLIVETLARLRSRSCIIDGEAVCCDDSGTPSFDRIPLSPVRRQRLSLCLRPDRAERRSGRRHRDLVHRAKRPTHAFLAQVNARGHLDYARRFWPNWSR